MKEDIIETVRRLGHGLLDLTQNRLKLVEHELAQELDRIGLLLARQMLLALSGLLTLQCLALLLVALTWDTPWRVPMTLALSIIAALATFLAYRSYRARRQRQTPIFASTQEELRKDSALLEKAS